MTSNNRLWSPLAYGLGGNNCKINAALLRLLECSMGIPKHLLHQTWTLISSLHDSELLGVFTSRPISDDW